MQFPKANDTVSVQDLAQLNDALRKGSVGHQGGATMSGEDLSPLVPQSIENTLASATYTMKELALWPSMPKVNVSQNLHEYVVVNEHGLDLDPFMAEGGGGSSFGTNRAEYERKSVKIKYMAERREVSDVASLIGLIGPNPQAIAAETERGTMSLLRKVERSLWMADEDVNPLAFDGVVKQIGRDLSVGGFHDGADHMGLGRPLSEFQLDLKGKAPTVQLLQEVLGHIYGAPFYGRPDCIYVEPRIHAELIQQSVQFGRHDQLMVQREGQALTFGMAELAVMAPYGSVKIKAAPFLHRSERMPAGASSSSAPAAPAFGAQPAETLAGAFAGGDKASDMEAGFYRYAIVAVSSAGYSAPVKAAAGIEVTADNARIDFTIADDSADYYRVYRTDKAAALGQIDENSYKLLCTVPNKAAQATPVRDLNMFRPDCSEVVFVEHSQDIMEFARLLDFIRRPLAEVATSRPFLLMLFGSPVVKVPRKCFVLRNAGSSYPIASAYGVTNLNFNP